MAMTRLTARFARFVLRVIELLEFRVFKLAEASAKSWCQFFGARMQGSEPRVCFR
jgi:hypothetical protein